MQQRNVILALFVCLLALAPVGQARQQPTTSAVIAGVVVDPSGGVIPGATVTLKLKGAVTETKVTNGLGEFRFERLAGGTYELIVSLPGFKTAVLKATVAEGAVHDRLTVTLEVGMLMESITVASSGANLISTQTPTVSATMQRQRRSRESYAEIISNPFKLTAEYPRSTFSADVDTASFTNVRRFLTRGALPPKDAVRIEELINYFRFSYPAPQGEHPLSITTEIGECPWAPGHTLALIGLRAKPIDDRTAPPRNITLLLDVSGSMSSADKLPLLKTAMRMFVDTLRDIDRLAIVVYAGSSGLVLPATPGAQRELMHDALERLEAGGSTNGAQGIQLAYSVARENFIDGGTNRVILATDGDFNVGITSREELLGLIERERKSGVFLSVLGVGMGNLKDDTMEMLADKGNGHYAYLDSLLEARRVLVTEGGATLDTVAKDVKFQIEFNPQYVSAYKLIGYENRLLDDRDFNDDTKDAGEVGAGHTVTALYELVPPGVKPPKINRRTQVPAISGMLRYRPDLAPPFPPEVGEILTVNVRYKDPNASRSRLILQPARSGAEPHHLPFASIVAQFGMLLRDAEPRLDEWRALSRRLDNLQSTVPAADRNSLAQLVELAAAMKGQTVRQGR